MRWSNRAFFIFSVAFGLVGCGVNDLPSDAVAGDSCVRTFECAAGLACVMGVCSSDLSGIEGNPPADGGMAYDGGAPVDAGAPVDSGTPPVDSGTPPVDSGTPPMDSGTPPADGG